MRPKWGMLKPSWPRAEAVLRSVFCVAYKVPLIAIWLKSQVRFKILCEAAFVRDRQLRAENTSLALHLSGPLL